MAASLDLIIRPYEPQDRDGVRKLCCETGFLGKPIDPVFEDRELFSDYLTSYYTDWEAEASFVIEHEGQIKGYLLGSRRPKYQQLHSFWMNLSLFARAARRYSGYNRATRDFIAWILKNSWREVPAAPRKAAHFHFNLLPEVQGLAGVRTLLNQYLDFLRSKGEKTVYGQVVTFEGRRGAGVFKRYGFEVLERREITKYRKTHPEPVYLTTVIKHLSVTPRAEASFHGAVTE